MKNREKGCLLSPEYRPSEGLLYYALDDGGHKIMYSEADYESKYKQYQEILQVLYKEYYNEKMPLDYYWTEQNIKIFTKSLVKCKK